MNANSVYTSHEHVFHNANPSQQQRGINQTKHNISSLNQKNSEIQDKNSSHLTKEKDDSEVSVPQRQKGEHSPSPLPSSSS